jgi:hypothetical protein
VLKPDGWENWSAVLSPDGRLMAVMTHYLEPGNEIRIYETATGTLRGTICAPCKIESFDFAPDGKTLATSCADTTVLIWDLHRPFAGGKATQPPPLNPAETEALWNSLGARDAMEMDRAFWALVRAPKQTVALLSQRLKPAQGPTSSQLQKWIANLDSKSFKERESATVELKQLGEQAFPAVQTTLLKKDISLEQRQRLEIILKHIENAGVDPAQLRELRAIEVLERIASSEALQLLKTLASRDDNSVLTREARAALTRLQATE